MADADFSFGDLLDTINPLQHIPAVSSIYRAVTGEAINPVARVAGDIIYGGAFGIASAVMGGVEAVASSAIKSQTGKDGIGYMVASLFGGDSSKTDTSATALAAATSPTAVASAAAPIANVTLTAAPVVPASSIQLAAAQPASTSPSPGFMSSIRLAAAQPVAAPVTPAPAPAADNAAPAPAPAAGDAKAFPLDRSKLAYSGKMTPINPVAQQTLAALSQSGVPMQFGRTIYTNPTMNGSHPAFVAPPPTAANPAPVPAPVAPAAATDAMAPAPTAAPAAGVVAAAPTTAPALGQLSPQRQPLPNELVDDMMILRALGQYKNVAGGSTPAIGAQVDVTN